VVEPRFRWLFPPDVELDPSFLAVGHGLGLTDRVLELLHRRGVNGLELGAFSGPAEAGLHDPACLPDAAIFAARVARARAGGERVMVFGDFDADGLTGLAILCRAFGRLGIDVLPYVPSRLDEGHGLSMAALDAAVVAGITLIVTVDCGTSSRAEIAAAVDRGIDVLVTDHHRIPPELPPALAIVNPQRADSAYPHRRLAGSGVAFKLAQLLLRNEPGGPEAALDLADLATIGTVADVAPILGENRSIARLGLERLRRSPRPGLAALLRRAGIDRLTADLETVSFAIAPRINAAGRVGEALDAARLLMTDDAAEAEDLAGRLDEANLARRALTKETIGDAEAAIDAAATAAEAADTDVGPAILVHGPWPVGIVGLVAARLAERRGRPAVVGADVGDVIRASCRSAGGFDLGAALERCGDLFVRHGGHQAAAGFEIEVSRWPEFVERFQVLAAAAVPPDPQPELLVDLALAALDVDYHLLAELAGMEPTGPGNPPPLVAVLGMTVTRVRPATGGHTQLTLRRRIDVLDAIAFGRADLAETVREGDRLDVVARVVSRRFGGYESIQLEIRDVAHSGSHPEARAILDGPEAAASALAGVAQ
jgi:single-stranded-DNA-specific exonuclease